MAEQRGKKKVVKVETAAPTKGSGKSERVWTPSDEARGQAKTKRIIAWVLWILAIAIEVAAIIWLLPQASEKLWLILVALVPIAGLAIGGNLLWKQANRLDPASEKNKVKFFVQNQLGAIMTLIAFLPLIIFILLDKNLDGKQKAIAGGVGAVVMILIGVFSGAALDGGPSQEQYANEENIMMRLTGKDEVFWVKGGSVFHVCSTVPDVQRESKDNQIYQGTVADAHAAGKDRLTSRWESEATKHCGYTQEEVEAVKAGLTNETGDGATDEAADEATDEAADDASDEATDEAADAPADEETTEE